jgi:hypothetical protein
MFQWTANRNLLFLLICLLAITLLYIKKAYKWGGWDSFAIWSQHARFFIDQNYWRNYLTNDIPWCHPDYPLMLSSYIAIIWRSTSIVSGIIPSIIAYLTLVSVPLIVYSFFKNIDKLWCGLLFTLMITLDFKFIEITSWLNADTLLGLFYLICFMIFILSKANINALYLLGFFTASCGWIKNEGNLFFLLFSFCLMFSRFNKSSELLRYFVGASLPILLIVFFKYKYSPDNDIIGGQSNQTFIKLADTHRYLVILKYYFFQLHTNYKVFLLFVLITIIVARNYFRSFGFIVLFGVIIGYFFVYVITPNDLVWHLSTSCERLLHQLYPSFIFTMLLSLSKNINDEQHIIRKIIKI